MSYNCVCIIPLCCSLRYENTRFFVCHMFPTLFMSDDDTVTEFMASNQRPVVRVKQQELILPTNMFQICQFFIENWQNGHLACFSNSFLYSIFHAKCIHLVCVKSSPQVPTTRIGRKKLIFCLNKLCNHLQHGARQYFTRSTIVSST